MSQSTSGEWILSASADLNSSELERALQDASELEMFVVPSMEDEAEEAIVELKATTSRPMWMDAEDAAVYEDALVKACTDYPIDVVRLACKAWRQVPNHGKWWPTEQDLRQQCEAIFRPRRSLFTKARALLLDLRSIEDAKRRAEAEKVSPFANDKGRAFREAMRKRLNARRFDAYFCPSQIMFRSDDVILVRNQTAERVLNEEGQDILSKLGVSVRYSPMEFVKVREPQPEHDTPEEHAETARKFHLLKEAMASGANIKQMRAEGKL